MARQFQPEESLRDNFCRAAITSLEQARSELRAAESQPEKAVHEARRGLKKLRAVLRLARPSLGETHALQNRQWRDAGRLLAASRDAAVMRKTFDKVAKRAAARIRADQLAALREVIALPAGHIADEGEGIAAALSLLDAHRSDLEHLPWPDDTKSLRRGLKESQTRLKRSWKAARRDPDAGTLHRWRKRVKDLSTQLDMLDGVLGSELKNCQADAKALAELLGEEHDLAMLNHAMAEARVPATLRAARNHLSKAVEARRKSLRAAAFKKGRAVSSHAPKARAKEIASLWKAAGQPAQTRSGKHSANKQA